MLILESFWENYMRIHTKCVIEYFTDNTIYYYYYYHRYYLVVVVVVVLTAAVTVFLLFN